VKKVKDAKNVAKV